MSDVRMRFAPSGTQLAAPPGSTPAANEKPGITGGRCDPTANGGPGNDLRAGDLDPRPGNLPGAAQSSLRPVPPPSTAPELAPGVLLPGEDRHEFDALHRKVIAEFQPDGLTEESLVLTLAALLWRRSRLDILMNTNQGA